MFPATITITDITEVNFILLFYLVLKTKILLSINLFLATCEVYTRTPCHSSILFVLRYIFPFSKSTDSIYLRKVCIYEECQASIRFGTGDISGPAPINAFICTWLVGNLGVQRVECGVWSVECGVWNGQMRSVDYGMGKRGSIKIWSVEKRTVTNRWN